MWQSASLCQWLSITALTSAQRSYLYHKWQKWQRPKKRRTGIHLIDVKSQIAFNFCQLSSSSCYHVSPGNNWITLQIPYHRVSLRTWLGHYTTSGSCICYDWHMNCLQLVVQHGPWKTCYFSCNSSWKFSLSVFRLEYLRGTLDFGIYRLWHELTHYHIFLQCDPYFDDIGCAHPGCEPLYPTPQCKKKCKVKNLLWEKTKHFSVDAYNVGSNPHDIMAEVYKNGPVEVAFTVYEVCRTNNYVYTYEIFCSDSIACPFNY